MNAKKHDHTADILLGLSASIICLAICIIGGIFHPNTIAGAIARFVFSLH